MRSLSLKTRISLALLVAFALVAGIATVFAKASFRETEIRHVREDSQARVDAIASIVDTRFLGLGQNAKAAAENAGNSPPARVLEEMSRAGFITAVVLGPNNTVLDSSGEARYNATLRELLVRSAPPPGYPASVYTTDSGWFFVGSRSLDLKTAVVGGMSHEYLSDNFLVDALIHSDYAHAVVIDGKGVIAASANYPEDRDAIAIVQSNVTGLLESFRDSDVYYKQNANLTFLSGGQIEGLAPSSAIASRVDAMTTRFLLSMAVAFGIGGSVTILLVAYSFRPLDRITDAARRLGRGEEDLHLEVRERDELGTLADVLNQSAAALGAARRAEAERAEEARLAAEDFELTVGDLSRSVGEAETPTDVASRLAEGVLRVTSARAVLVLYADEVLAAADRDGELTTQSLMAFYASDRDAFQLTRARSGDAELQVAALPEHRASLPLAQMRKIEILTAQGGIAIHRARSAVELKRAKAQKETFLDILSHDLKNPIAVARGRVELLSMKDSALAPKLEPIEKSLERATRIIEEAVLLSKLERADQLERAPLALAPLVEESAASLRPLAAPRNISITVDAQPEARWPANRLLARAIENIISNAIKWSPDGSPVEIRVVTAESCRIEIIDHGPGIPAADRQRLFARFERADRTGVKGTGLGLAIAKRVTEMHGGRIHIEDTPGGGCTFVIEIPHTTEAAVAPPAKGGRA
ncbi:MAG TPA: ATP-binding protein [Candidatus Thermoplasmatota archaeon]|nr:ATP-binding protein [Candidatus Thermoplasmatota archaeon]